MHRRSKTTGKWATDLWWSLTALAVVSALQNGVYPSLLTFAFLKYPAGNDWLSHYLVTSFLIAPLPPALVGLVQLPYPRTLLSAILALSSYVVWAAYCDRQSLQFGHADYGGMVIMAVLVVAQALIGYFKTYLFFTFKATHSPRQHAAVYKCGGYAIQAGSCAASFTMLLLVRLQVFRQ